MTDQITVVIAEDHPIFRKGLTEVLGEDPSFRLIGEAGDGDTALAMIRRRAPRVAVLDVEMPGSSGLEVAETVKREGLDTAVVILTMYRDADLLRRALDLGVRGYLLKDNAVDDIVACLNIVACGRSYVSAALSDAGGTEPTDSGSAGLDLERLTPAERRILQRVAAGLTSAEIAADLGVALKTVENHRSHICRKLGLRGPQALLRFAMEHRGILK